MCCLHCAFYKFSKNMKRIRVDEIALLKRPEQPSVLDKVQDLIEDFRKGSDAALKKYSVLYDKYDQDTVTVTDEEIRTAIASVDESLKRDISFAIENIKKFQGHAIHCREDSLTIQPGVICGYRYVPIERVGIYVPAGTAPLFSSLYMAIVPAVLAGVKEIVVSVPPRPDGTLDPVILYVVSLFKDLADIQVIKVGGAQAVAAMAFGTSEIPKVYKIVGPGGPFITTAKQLLSNLEVDIDLVGGPSEVVIIADSSANPACVAADLLAQAEHGSTSQTVLLATNEELIGEVQTEIENQLKTLPRAEYAFKSIENSYAIFVNTIEAMRISNEYAPEHLIINTANALELSYEVVNAGSVFIGEQSPEVVGDYGSGTNHILPTSGWAKTQSGVSPLTFLKKITFQNITKKGLEGLLPLANLARAEGLEAHARAIEIRVRAEK